MSRGYNQEEKYGDIPETAIGAAATAGGTYTLYEGLKHGEPMMTTTGVVTTSIAANVTFDRVLSLLSD